MSALTIYYRILLNKLLPSVKRVSTLIHLHYPIGLLIPGLAGLLFSTLAMASNDDWYQVEILAFTYVTPEHTSNEEWPAEINASYPQSLQHVQQGSAWIVLEDSYWQTPFERALTPYSAYDSVIEQFLNERRTDIPDSVLLRVPAPFRTVSSADLTLRTQARRMRNSRNYRVLLHEGWRQPIGAASTARAVAISGGQHRGDYPELQGSVSMRAGRYLHVSTALWLNTDSPLVPEQSPPPMHPVVRNTEPWQFKVDPSQLDLSQQFLFSASPGIDSAYLYFSTADAGERFGEYPFRGAVMLEDERRMRSGEQHFLDHPLFGLLIKAERFNAGAPP